jgi:glycosyltransferase involved in cell wall biosynthesis
MLLQIEMAEIPRAGLVMAAYNATAYLERAVEAVMNQEFTDFACRIVDDGSTDGTADLARRLTANDSRFIVEEVTHGGQSAARNFGVTQLPLTEYLSFPDADDVWHPEALSSLITAADDFDGIGAHALGDWVDVDGTPFGDGEFARFGRERFTVRRFKKHLIPLDQPTSFDSLLWSCTVYPPGVWILRRDAFDRAGGFDPGIRQFEDWDLQIRASRFGDFAFLDKVIVDYRLHPAQITANPRAEDAIGPLRDKTVRSSLNTPHQRKAATLAWRAHELRDAAKSASLILKDPKNAPKHVLRTVSHLIRGLAGPAWIHPHNSDAIPAVSPAVPAQ